MSFSWRDPRLQRAAASPRGRHDSRRATRRPGCAAAEPVGGERRLEHEPRIDRLVLHGPIRERAFECLLRVRRADTERSTRPRARASSRDHRARAADDSRARRRAERRRGLRVSPPARAEAAADRPAAHPQAARRRPRRGLHAARNQRTPRASTRSAEWPRSARRGSDAPLRVRARAPQQSPRRASRASSRCRAEGRRSRRAAHPGIDRHSRPRRSSPARRPSSRRRSSHPRSTRAGCNRGARRRSRHAPRRSPRA